MNIFITFNERANNSLAYSASQILIFSSNEIQTKSSTMVNFEAICKKQLILIQLKDYIILTLLFENFIYSFAKPLMKYHRKSSTQSELLEVHNCM